MEVHSLPRNSLADTRNWFSKAVPNPSQTNVTVQIGVHFEEVAEMVAEIQTDDSVAAQFLEVVQDALNGLANHLKKVQPELRVRNRVQFLDSICDQLVTATGSAYMLNMDPVGGLIEVNTSNYSKFIDGEPLFDENKKIKKGPDYRKPDLSPFV